MGSSASKPSSSSTTTIFDFPSPAVHKAFSFPMPLVHHPPARKGDTHHLVSLTSTSYGSLLLIDLEDSKDKQTPPRISIACMKNESDPVSPDSVINTSELMDGLDDKFEFEIPKSCTDLNSEFCFKPDEIQSVNLGLCQINNFFRNKHSLINIMSQNIVFIFGQIYGFQIIMFGNGGLSEIRGNIQAEKQPHPHTQAFNFNKLSSFTYLLLLSLIISPNCSPILKLSLMISDTVQQ